MSELTSSNSKMVFANVRQLAKYLNVSERRMRQYRASGRRNYTTDAVLVDLDELQKMKRSQANYLAPYIPPMRRTAGTKRNS